MTSGTRNLTYWCCGGSSFDRLARDWWRQRRGKKRSGLTSARAGSSSFVQTPTIPSTAQLGRFCCLKISQSHRSAIHNPEKISKHLMSDWSEMTLIYRKASSVKEERDWGTNWFYGLATKMTFWRSWHCTTESLQKMSNVLFHDLLVEAQTSWLQLANTYQEEG